MPFSADGILHTQGSISGYRETLPCGEQLAGFPVEPASPGNRPQLRRMGLRSQLVTVCMEPAPRPPRSVLYLPLCLWPLDAGDQHLFLWGPHLALLFCKTGRNSQKCSLIAPSSVDVASCKAHFPLPGVVTLSGCPSTQHCAIRVPVWVRSRPARPSVASC